MNRFLATTETRNLSIERTKRRISDIHFGHIQPEPYPTRAEAIAVEERLLKTIEQSDPFYSISNANNKIR